MDFVPGVLLMMMMVPAAVVAGIVGWLALRRTTPNWIGVACAYAILLSPFVLGTVLWSGGLQLAVYIAFFTGVTPLVGVALTAGVLLKYNKRD